MKNKVIWLGFSLLFVAAMLLASCSKVTSTSTSTLTSTSTSTSTTTSTSTSTTVTSTSTPTMTPTATGAPQYGGTVTLQITQDPPVWDMLNYNQGNGSGTVGDTLGIIYEGLAGFDLSVDRNVWNFMTQYVPIKYNTGRLAQSWEIAPDWMSYTFHIRQGVHWQNIAPVNGREFTAYDEEWNWNRNLGLNGFPKSPYYPTANFVDIISVTATDKYTVVFKTSRPSSAMLSILLDSGSTNGVQPREAVELWGNLNDWRHQIGTGPFMIKDDVPASSVTFIKNPNYYMYDYKYPQNRLPYADQVNLLVIVDPSTAIAGLRTGKLDLYTNINFQQVASIKKTNPELQQITRPLNGDALWLMVDKAPFNDINVRKAMQMSIDLNTIAQSLYGGYVTGTPVGLVGQQGYYVPYAEWPQDVKDGYTYNVAGAKKLLAAAGYPTGFSCTAVTANNYDLDLVQILKSYLAVIGVDMTVQVMTPAAFTTYITAGLHQMCFYTGYNGTFPPINALNSDYSKHYRSTYGHINDPVFDGLMDKLKASIDENQSAELSKQADMRGITMQWRVMVLPKVAMDLYQPWFHGYQGEVRTLYTVGPYLWIDQNLKKSMGR